MSMCYVHKIVVYGLSWVEINRLMHELKVLT